MGSALWAGISGLSASSKQLDVIANNLANVNTIGFKSGETFFGDVLSSSISGGASGTMQVGRGVAVSEVQTQFGAGSFQSTGNATDTAIDGDGFFMVNDAEGGTYYTRAGAFHLNSDGLLVDINDYKVQGQMIINGVLSPLGDINLQGLQSAPAVTTTVSLGANLNATTATGGKYTTTQTVYDSLGAKHTLNTTFTKTAYAGADDSASCWSVQCFLDSSPVNSISANGFIFNSDGICTGLYTGTSSTITAEHNTVSSVGTVSHASSAALAGTTGGITVPGGIIVDQAANIYKNSVGNLVCSWDEVAGTWTLSNDGGFAGATLTDVGGVININLDGVGGPDLHFTPATAGADGTVSLSLTHAATATAALDHPGAVSLTGTMTLKCDDISTNSWSISNKGGYTNANIVSANATTVNVDLDGDGITDAHLALAGTWANDDTATFTLNNVPDASTATVTLDRPGMIYQTGEIRITRDGAAWRVEGGSVYAKAIVTSPGLTEPVTISLDGTGTTDITLTPTSVWANGDTAVFTLTNTPSAINDITLTYTTPPLNGGATIGTEGNIKWKLVGDGALDITQYSSSSVTRSISADGYASGQLKSLSIDNDGKISGFFTNGQTSELAQLILASFPNPWGLSKLGKNLFGETITSGSSLRNIPGASGMGSLTPSTLEMSNTDIASEFVKMITAQKAYQANAKVVTTEDQMMSVLMSIKQ